MDKDMLQAVKVYMRVDGDEDDALIESLYEAAGAYLARAGVRDDGSALYNLAIRGLALHYYDHRDVSEGMTAMSVVPLGLRQIITQLKLTAGVASDG